MSILHTILPAGLLALLPTIATAANDVAAPLTTYKLNAGWCWFQDPRVIYTNGQLVFGSVAGTSDGNATGGSAYVTGYNVGTGATTNFFLRNIGQDDHNAPAFSVLPDGRILTEYATHGANDLMYWRVSTSAGNVANFGAEQTTDLNPANDGNGTTYANPFYLSTPNRVYNFSRTIGYDTNYSVYSNLNATTPTHSYGGYMLRFVNPNSGQGPGRPYVKYASNGTDKIWFVTTEDHPRNYTNSLYAGYVQFNSAGVGTVYTSTGTAVGPLNTTSGTAGAFNPQSFTKIFANGFDAATNGTFQASWGNDLKLDANGNPYTVFSTRFNGVTTADKLRYYYARFDGTSWTTRFLAYAGKPLYSAENDYAGLVTADPSAANIVYLSTNVDPATGTALISNGDSKQHYELFKGTTNDNGQTWDWLALTSNSTVDNLRPVATAISASQTSLIWMRGSYTSYTNYSTNLVGITVSVPEPSALAALGFMALGLRRHRR